jgi:NodT family efflux transporter outer membrane factor (OMF) lipoprotein
MKIRREVAVLSVLALLLGACATVGPDYVKPKVQEPEEWIEEDDLRIRSEPADLSNWWKVFDDPILDDLIERAYHQNLSLQIVGIRILEARAQLGIAIGNLYPQTQNVGGALTVTGLSENGANTTSDLDFDYNELALGFNAGWEIDLWGKFRRGMQSSFANLQGTIASYDDFLVSLTADVARTYVLIRTFEARLEVAHENVKIQERTLQIAESQFEGGLVTELDVQQARNLLSSTKASIPPLEAGQRQAQNALATLLGTLPEKTQEILIGPEPIPSAPAEVVVGIPAELLRRRPDIRLAERQVAAQSPLIGVAKADLYPHFSLFGTIGLRASDAAFTAAGFPGGSKLKDLFSSDSLEWFAGPSFTWNIFNYGRIKNRVRVEDARLQQLAVNYQNTVLKAVQEVEDGLVSFLKANDARDLQIEAVKAAKRSVEISLVQYGEGLVDYQRVLDAERALAASQDALISTMGFVATNLIAVYRALGGGWEIRVGKEFVPPEIKEEMGKRTDWDKLLTPEAMDPQPEKIQKVLPGPDW